MDEDMSALEGAYAPLSVDDSNGSFDFATQAPVSSTAAAPPSTNSSATGANPAAGVSGFQTVLNTLTSAFSGGVAAYNTVAQNVGLPLANGTPTTPAVAAAVEPVVFAGMTQSQLLLVGGGVTLIAVLFLMKKR